MNDDTVHFIIGLLLLVLTLVIMYFRFWRNQVEVGVGRPSHEEQS